MGEHVAELERRLAARGRTCGRLRTECEQMREQLHSESEQLCAEANAKETLCAERNQLREQLYDESRQLFDTDFLSEMALAADHKCMIDELKEESANLQSAEDAIRARVSMQHAALSVVTGQVLDEQAELQSM